MTMRCAVALMVLAAALAPTPMDAGGPDVVARSSHARVRATGDTVLSLDNVHLVAPRGALPGGAVLGLGTGGVAGRSGIWPGTSFVVSFSGRLLSPLVVVIIPSAVDVALTGSGTAAVVDSALGTAYPCAAGAGRMACLVNGPGAFVTGRTDAPPVDDPLVVETVAALLAPEHHRGLRLVVVIAVAVAAAVIGGGTALLFDSGRLCRVAP